PERQEFEYNNYLPLQRLCTGDLQADEACSGKRIGKNSFTQPSSEGFSAVYIYTIFASNLCVLYAAILHRIDWLLSRKDGNVHIPKGNTEQAKNNGAGGTQRWHTTSPGQTAI
ncbi:MAG: hypothetical protein LUE87_00345, partial [Lachnospiraceae bacterium]|nr:hypothetical protein [Lachnospiraceae bacterium]